MSPEVQDELEVARLAMDRHRWKEARQLLSEADAAGKLDAEGLRLYAKAAEWCSDISTYIDALERSYASFVAAGNRRRAADVALMLRHACMNNLTDVAAARGWVQRAEHLLENEPECIEHGWLWRAKGRRLFKDGRAEEGRDLLERAIELGERLGDPNLAAMSRSFLGVGLWEIGHREEAFAILDEACAAAVGGELGPFATGFVYCNTISIYRDAGEFSLGGEWSQTASRWCQRESISGFSGICRVHRAEFMRLRGALSDAEGEARRAAIELESNTPFYAAEAFYEIGLVRLRLGDLAGAEAGFRRAHELGREPQPGQALLLAARGDLSAALRSIQAGSIEPSDSVLDAMRCASVETEIACELGELDIAEQAVQRAESLAEGQPGGGLRALAAQARGCMQLARNDPEAHRTIRRALRLWQEIDAPYEVAQARLLLSRALRKVGDEVGARREIDAAVAGFDRLGAQADASLAKQMLGGGSPATVARRTFLFSDVVGSTELVQAIGDRAWHDLLIWLDGSLRSCFQSHTGEEVDHAGDGFFVAFPDARSALDCAISIQRKLADHRREHGFAPRIRIGVHATSARQSAGRYRGRGVHEASRIASLAEADEIVASAESVPPGFAMSEPREVMVKGIGKPLQVVTVGWTG